MEKRERKEGGDIEREWKGRGGGGGERERDKGGQWGKAGEIEIARQGGHKR